MSNASLSLYLNFHVAKIDKFSSIKCEIISSFMLRLEDEGGRWCESGAPKIFFDDYFSWNFQHLVVGKWPRQVQKDFHLREEEEEEEVFTTLSYNKKLYFLANVSQQTSH